MGQGGNPIRVTEQHFINTPTGFGTIFNIFKGLFAKGDLLVSDFLTFIDDYTVFTFIPDGSA